MGVTEKSLRKELFTEVWQFKDRSLELEPVLILKGQREGAVTRACCRERGAAEQELQRSKAVAKQGGGRRNQYPSLSLLPLSSLLSWNPIG